MKSKRPYLLLLAMAIIYNLWVWRANMVEKPKSPELKKEILVSNSLTAKK